METAPLFPSPAARMYPWIRTKRPLDALAETSTEGTPTRPHVWFQLRPRPHLEASSDGPRHRLWSRAITPTKEIGVRRPSGFSKLGTGQTVEEGEKWFASPRVTAGLLAG